MEMLYFFVVVVACVLIVMPTPTLTPSKRFVNTLTCGFTPTGGSSTPITGITSLSVDEGPELLTGAGDGDLYETFMGVFKLAPVIKIDTNEPFLLNAIISGTPGTLVFTRADGKNAASAGGGALIYTVINAVFMRQADTAPHRQLATGSFEFHPQSADGQTSPISQVAA